MMIFIIIILMIKIIMTYTDQVEEEVYNHTHGDTDGTNGEGYPTLNR